MRSSIPTTHSDNEEKRSRRSSTILKVQIPQSISDVERNYYAIAAQPLISQHDYRSEELFTKKLSNYMKKVDDKIPNEDVHLPKLVVFPETIGSWLVGVGEPRRIFNFSDILLAMVPIIVTNAFSFTREIATILFKCTITRSTSSADLAKAKKIESTQPPKSVNYESIRRFGLMGNIKRVLFRIKAPLMFSAYVRSFSKAAKDHQSYIVAGSIFLPRVILDSTSEFGVQLTNDGLFNISFVFAPTGQVVFIRYKDYTIPDEQEFMNSGFELDHIPQPANHSRCVVNLPGIGRVGVLICADSWAPESYQRLLEEKVEVIATPSFVSPAQTWLDIWGGYTIYPKSCCPPDVDKNDIKKDKTENLMWEKYAVQGRMGMAGAVVALNSFMHGRVWNMTCGGQSVVKVRSFTENNKEEYSKVESPYHQNFEDVVISRISL